MPEAGYEQWLERERRIRLRILGQSPSVSATGLYRLCADCGEALLCHEQDCPHCGGARIEQAALAPGQLAARVRLGLRWRAICGQGS